MRDPNDTHPWQNQSPLPLQPGVNPWDIQAGGGTIDTFHMEQARVFAQQSSEHQRRMARGIALETLQEYLARAGEKYGVTRAKRTKGK